MSDVVLDQHGVEFTHSDGTPMAESEIHAAQIVYLREALEEQARRRGEPGVHVAGNQFFYWDPTDAKKRIAPDVYRATGLLERERRSFKLWEEGRGPDLVIEVASPDTWQEDLGPKKELYREVFKVAEYVVFDPDPVDDEREPLRAFRLVGDAYRRAGTTERFESRVVGATFQVIERRLRICDGRGKVVPGGVQQAREVFLREGHESGLREGQEAGLRLGLVTFIEARFGPLAPGLRARVDRLDVAALQQALVRAATAASVEAALE